MNALAILVVIAAWGSVFWRPGTVVGVLVFLLFCALGTGFALAGGFSYWWDSSMMPGRETPLLLVCGLLTLASQGVIFIRNVLGEQPFTW